MLFRSGFTGIDDPYEPPLHPELVLRSAEHPPESLALAVLDYLEQQHRIPKPTPPSNPTNR